MNISTRAKQKNFLIDTQYYTEDELELLCDVKLIHKISNYDNGYDYRVFTSTLREVKVILENGYYLPVVITNDGFKLHVILY